MKFVISKDGPVSSARVKTSDFQDEVFHTCMVAVFESLTFPEPRGEGFVIVSYPFVFSRW
jgi:hypothetical protein